MLGEAALEPSLSEEEEDLVDDVVVERQQVVRVGKDDVVGHALDAGRGHRDRAVVAGRRPDGLHGGVAAAVAENAHRLQNGEICLLVVHIYFLT